MQNKDAIERANRIIRGLSDFVMRPDYCQKHAKAKLVEASKLLGKAIYSQAQQNHIVDANDMVGPALPIVAVHIDAHDNVPNYYVSDDANVDLLIIDDNVPHDRVYKIGGRVSAKEIIDLIGDSPIGDEEDGGNDALVNKIKAFQNDGKPDLKEV